MRVRWPFPEREEVARALLDVDRHSLEERIRRVQELRAEFGPPADMLLYGGFEALYALQEMQNCYVTGNSMAVVLLAQTFIEHALAAGFMMSGEDEIAEGGFARITKRAKDTTQISPELFERLEILRKMRNPYVHPKVGLKSGSSVKRFIDSGFRNPRDLADADAKLAIEIVVDFIRYGAAEWLPSTDADTEASGSP